MHHRHLLQQQPRFLVIIVFEVVVIIKRVGEQTKLLGVCFEFVVGGWMKYGFFFFNLFFLIFFSFQRKSNFMLIRGMVPF